MKLAPVGMFDHLVKIVTTSSLHYKGTFFPLSLISNLRVIL